jgi:hypothetical protein
VSTGLRRWMHDPLCAEVVHSSGQCDGVRPLLVDPITARHDLHAASDLRLTNLDLNSGLEAGRCVVLRGGLKAETDSGVRLLHTRTRRCAVKLILKLDGESVSPIDLVV